MNILLDMDGVLANFRDAAARANWLRPDAHIEEWNFHHVAGLTDEAFYANIAADVEFWHKLEPYPWMEELLSVVSNYDPEFCITTAAHPSAIAGKTAWIDKHIGSGFSRVMFGTQKHLFARPGAVLIDDYDFNVAGFRKSGGIAITFPQPWNAGRECLPCDRAEHVHQMLDTIQSIEDAP